MQLLDLPNELLLYLSDRLESESSINALARANHRLYDLLNVQLYRHNVQQSKSSALLWAAGRGKKATVERLLKEQANVHVVDCHNRTPLSLAASNGRALVLRTLLCNGANGKIKDVLFGWNALSWAVWKGQTAIVEILLQEDSIDPDLKDDDGQTPLALAACDGHNAIARLLLDTKKVDVDSTDLDGQTPLMNACFSGRVRLVRLLLETGRVNVNSTDFHGRTPLMYAALIGSGAVVEMLIKIDKVDLNCKDTYGYSAFSLAVWKGNAAVVKVLLRETKVEVDLDDLENRIPLWATHGIRCGHKAIMKLLRSSSRANTMQDTSMDRGHPRRRSYNVERELL